MFKLLNDNHLLHNFDSVPHGLQNFLFGLYCRMYSVWLFLIPRFCSIMPSSVEMTSSPNFGKSLSNSFFHFVHLVALPLFTLSIIKQCLDQWTSQQIEFCNKSYHNRLVQIVLSSATALVLYVNLWRLDYKVLVMVNAVWLSQSIIATEIGCSLLEI